MDFKHVFLDEPVRVVCVERPSGQPTEVPSFVPGPHYAGNFARQWSIFRNTQLDSVNQTTISKDFLEQLLGEPIESLSGKSVLEIGAGAGRFSEHLVKVSKLVVAVDLSEAVFVNVAIGAPNFVAAQADLLAMPAMRQAFDLVLCRGVLQHTPDPIRAIQAIHDLTGEAGQVVFDIYSPGRLGRLGPKYVWRPLVKRIFTFDSFSSFLDSYAERILRCRWALRRIFRGKSRIIVDYALPIWDYRGVLPLSEQQLIEWAKLDTLDAMFAVHDHPMKHEEVISLLTSMNIQISSTEPQLNAFRTEKPISAKSEVS